MKNNANPWHWMTVSQKHRPNHVASTKTYEPCQKSSHVNLEKESNCNQMTIWKHNCEI